MIYISTHAANPPLELFVRVKGPDCTAETIVLYDILPCLTNVALQYEGDEPITMLVAPAHTRRD